jgi:membrane protease YdiL (CAAX protease family)
LSGQTPPDFFLLFFLVHFLFIGFIERSCILCFPFEQIHKILTPWKAIIFVTIPWYLAHKVGSPMFFDPLTYIFTGFLPIVAYYKSRNSIPLIIAYPIYEGPVWWTIATLFGSLALKIYALLLLVVGVTSLVVLLIQYLKKLRFSYGV